jgi:hypothetical protein
VRDDRIQVDPLKTISLIMDAANRHAGRVGIMSNANEDGAPYFCPVVAKRRWEEGYPPGRHD